MKNTFILSSFILAASCFKTLAQANYPTATSRGDVVETYIVSNNAIEIGLANAGNARRAWLLSRHETTLTFGQWYSTFHIQPDVGDKSQYRGVAIGYSGDTILPLQTHLAVNGNVGIGTVSPRERLSVNGNIRAKEVKVESTPWPDYVFETDYIIPPLSEVEAFIKVNKHLPGIPTQAEVAEYGINLGEMNSKLLEKIEELTLHLIAKDKEMGEVRKQLSDLSEAMREIKESIHQ